MPLYPGVEVDYTNYKIRFVNSDRAEKKWARLASGSLIIASNEDVWVEWGKETALEMARLLRLPGEVTNVGG